MPQIFDKFINKKPSNYLGNLKFRGDLPFAVYFDFETLTMPYNDFIMENA